MVYFATDLVELALPEWVVDLESFRRWIDAEDVPEKARISYLDNDVWVDMSKEQVFSHVLVKTEMTAVLRNLVKKGKLGLFLGDGVRLTSIEANFSVRPDSTFVLQATLASKRVRVVERMEEG
jgi:hypothetical protein